jgi:hypothetical protein
MEWKEGTMSSGICRVGLFFAMLVIFGFGIGGCAAKSPPEPGRYYDEARGFSIKFPAGWKIQEEIGGATIAALSPLENDDDMFYECVSVTVEDLPHEISLDELFEGNKEAILRDFADVQIDGTGKVAVADRKAKWIYFGYQMEEGTVQALEYCLVKDRRGYFIMCDSETHKYAAYSSILEEAAKSFRFE